MLRYNETDDGDDSKNLSERNNNSNSYVHDGRTVVYECRLTIHIKCITNTTYGLRGLGRGLRCIRAQKQLEIRSAFLFTAKTTCNNGDTQLLFGYR